MNPDRRFYVLAALGLLAVGLLGGVLATLWLAPAPAPQVVLPARAASEPADLGVLDTSAQVARVPAPSADLAGLSDRFREVSQTAQAAVVFIEVESRPARTSLLRRFRGNPDDLPVLPQSIGSGVIVSADGYVLTNNHVIEGARRLSVTLADRRQFEAEVVGIDPATDLAVIRLEGAQGLPTLPIGDSDALQVGDWVMAVGNPFKLTSTVTLGIVSALARQVGVIDAPYPIEDFIQTDAAINPGNSGGALVSLTGELIGIATAIATDSGSYEGYGFAIPSNLALRIATDLIESGQVARGFLGVTLGEVSPRMAGRLGMDDVRGVLLRRVPVGSSAYQSGLRPGDVVLSVGERAVNEINELQSAVARYRAGDTVELGVRRGREEQAFRVPLVAPTDPAASLWMDELPGDAPGLTPDLAPPSDVETNQIGLGLRDLTPADRRAFGTESGAVLAFVEQGTRADWAGVPEGGVLTAIEGDLVVGADDAADLLAVFGDEEPILLHVLRRDGTTAFYEIEPQP
jgi:Do/DeqQ family serine protease